jgi:hypothetical protein
VIKDQQLRLAVTAAGRAALDAAITQQAQIIAYVNDYKLLMIASIAVIPLLIAFKKPADDQSRDGVGRHLMAPVKSATIAGEARQSGWPQIGFRRRRVLELCSRPSPLRQRKDPQRRAVARVLHLGHER